MRKLHPSVAGLVILATIWPLNMVCTLVENSNVKVTFLLATTLFVTAGLLFSLFGLKYARHNYVFSRSRVQIIYMLLGGLGILFHSFLYVFFVIYCLAVSGSVNTWLGLIAFVLVIIVPVLIGYKTSGVYPVRKRAARKNTA